jgi:uncharacterized protein
MPVALVTQPYRVAGRRAPAPARHLDEAWLACRTAAAGGAVAQWLRSGMSASGRLLLGPW